MLPQYKKIWVKMLPCPKKTFRIFLSWKRAFNLNKFTDRIIYSCLQSSQHGKHVCKFQSNISKGYVKMLHCQELEPNSTLNWVVTITKSLMGLPSTCLQTGLIMVIKYSRFQNNISKSKVNMPPWLKTSSQFQSWKQATILTKSFFWQTWIIMFNWYWKYHSNA